VDEALVMGLRLAEGVDVEQLTERFGVAVVDWAKVDRVAASGHLVRDGGRIALAPAGRLLLDHILGEIAARP
jgi:oxygen-independent coproporphyrinogen-3 oxidase